MRKLAEIESKTRDGLLPMKDISDAKEICRRCKALFRQYQKTCFVQP